MELPLPALAPCGRRRPPPAASPPAASWFMPPPPSPLSISSAARSALLVRLSSPSTGSSANLVSESPRRRRGVIRPTRRQPSNHPSVHRARATPSSLLLLLMVRIRSVPRLDLAFNEGLAPTFTPPHRAPAPALPPSSLHFNAGARRMAREGSGCCLAASQIAVCSPPPGFARPNIDEATPPMVA
ncbi:hypothetical protein ZWY2020_057125 [Hordeum vulgare]|nr:hypothetical protein ZWY2020_057125 [Hordeum vulgare]